MSISVSYGGTSILQGIQPTSIECAQLADMGETATGAFTVEDDAAALTLIGYQPLTISESACSQPLLFKGWTFERGYQRDEENAILTGVARTHDVSIVDMNACFGFRQITRTGAGGGNRPAETWAARLTWILESEYLSDWISSDQSFVVTNTTMCDEADYRGSYPSAVLNDLSERSGDAYDYFAFWDPVAKEVRLFFDNSTEAIADCTLRISNVLADQDQWTIFGPDKVAKLQRESDQVYSDVCVNYKDGTLKYFASRPATYATYVRRSTQIDRPYTRTAATAKLQATAWLDKHAAEKDRVTCTIRVPAARVGLIQAGQRIQFKAPHMPGYSAYVWMRIVMCTPKPANEAATLYDIALELVGSVAPPELCPDPTPSGTFYPLGGAGNDSNPSPGDGNLMYGSPGSAPPYVPTPGLIGDWNFPSWGAGGIGTKDVAGDCVGNMIRLAVVGPGTVTFHTTAEAPHACPIVATRGHGGAVDATTDHTAGDDIVVVLPVPSVDWCESWVAISDGGDPEVGCGGAWGFTGVEWVAGSGADDVTDLGPTPGATTTHTVDPTVNDDVTLGYGTPGMRWINTTTGHEFVLIDGTDGAAVWVSTTAISVFSFSTSDGVTTVDPTTELTFVGATLADLGGGVAELTVATPTIALDDVTDVTITAVATDDVLTYDGAGWVNGAPAGGHILLADGHGTPFTFDDLLQMDDGSDFMWSD